jgi:hypothetical protein
MCYHTQSRTVFSTKGTGYLHVKDEVRSIASHVKINSKWTNDLIKLSEENTGVCLHDLGFGNGFSDNNTKETAMEKNKLDFIKS